jgi:hypothetical protein
MFSANGHIRHDNNKRVHAMHFLIGRILQYAHLQEFPSHFRVLISIE